MKRYMNFYEEHESLDPVRQANINGNIVFYDACSDGDLEEAKEFYLNFEYIGSGKGLILDGVHCCKDVEYHFFTRKRR